MGSQGRSPRQGLGAVAPVISLRHGCRVCMHKGSMQGRIQVVEQSRCMTHRQQTTTVAQMQSQQSIHSPSPRGRGLGFRQGCRDRTPKGFARTQSPQSVLKGIENLPIFYKNRFFLQTETSALLNNAEVDLFTFYPYRAFDE